MPLGGGLRAAQTYLHILILSTHRLCLNHKHETNDYKKRNRHKNITIIWDVMPCSLVDLYHHFEGTYCLHLQIRRVKLSMERSVMNRLSIFTAFSSILVVLCVDWSVFCPTLYRLLPRLAHCTNPEDGDSKFLRNVDNDLPDNTVSLPILMRKNQIS